MFADVLASLRRVDGLDGVAVVTADPTAERGRSRRGRAGAARHGAGGAVGGRFDRDRAMRSPRASSACCSCPGDTPLLDPAEVESLLAIPRAVSIVPDRHGTGTNALVLSPPDAIAPSFGPGSLKRHVAAAEAAGVPSAVEKIPTLMLDVDTGDDLSALTAALAERRGQAPATREALHGLERPGRQPVAPA